MQTATHFWKLSESTRDGLTHFLAHTPHTHTRTQMAANTHTHIHTHTSTLTHILTHSDTCKGIGFRQTDIQEDRQTDSLVFVTGANAATATFLTIVFV